MRALLVLAAGALVFLIAGFVRLGSVDVSDILLAAGFAVAAWGARRRHDLTIGVGLVVSFAGMALFLAPSGFVPRTLFLVGETVFAVGLGGAAVGVLTSRREVSRIAWAVAAAGALVWAIADARAGNWAWLPGDALLLAGSAWSAMEARA